MTSTLPGTASKPGASTATKRAGEDDADEHQDAQDDGQEREQARGQAMRALPALLLERARGVGRHEGRGERALGEQVAQQVGDPEGDLEGVRVEARRRGGPRRPARARGPGARETRVRAETRPAARAIRARGAPLRRCSVVLTSAPNAGKLRFCPSLGGGIEWLHHASALKQKRQSLKHRARNRKNVSQAQDPGQEAARRHRQGRRRRRARSSCPETVGEIDKAAKKGVVHDNAAARYKSRLSRKVNALAAAKA